MGYKVKGEHAHHLYRLEDFFSSAPLCFPQAKPTRAATESDGRKTTKPLVMAVTSRGRKIGFGQIPGGANVVL